MDPPFMSEREIIAYKETHNRYVTKEHTKPFNKIVRGTRSLLSFCVCGGERLNKTKTKRKKQ